MELGQMIQYTNALAAQNNTWSAQQAEKQMQFQKNMSDTAHQREVADLKAAGLNPVLSASHNGASTPAGAMGGTDNGNIEAVVSLLTHFGESIAQATAKGAAHGASSGNSTNNILGLVDKLPLENGKNTNNTTHSGKQIVEKGLPTDYDWSFYNSAEKADFWNDVSKSVSNDKSIGSGLANLLGIKTTDQKTKGVKKALQTKYGKDKGEKIYNWISSPGAMIGTALGKKLGLRS